MNKSGKKTSIGIEAMQRHTILKRAILGGVALIVLIAAVVYLTLGWYTKMTGVAYTEFTVARWDFTANYQIDDFEINVYEYDTPDGKNIAAPGTAGTLDIRLGADDSDTDVHFLVQIDKSTMSSEFQKRIYFYYEDEDGEKQEFIYGVSSVEGTIKAGGFAFVTLYWEWVYDYAEYLDKSTKNPFRNVAYEIANRYAENYEALGFDYDVVKEILSAINTIPLNEREILRESFETGSGSVAEGSAAIKNAVIQLENANNKSLVRSVFQNYDDYKNRSDAFTTKYYTPIGAGKSNEVFSSAMARLGEARSSAELDSSLIGFQSELTDENTATPYDYLNTYCTYFNLTSVKTMSDEIARESELFDEYDTKIADYPDYYKQLMNAKVYIIGEQIHPTVVTK